MPLNHEQMTLNFVLQKSHNNQVNEQLIKERTQFEERLRKDIGTLKEQLQVHIQTIGILVAEKSELQSGLNQTQKTAEQRYGEYKCTLMMRIFRIFPEFWVFYN
jgi:hypothetical protein